MKTPMRAGAALALALSTSLAVPPSAHAADTRTWDHVSTGLALGIGGAAALTALSKSDSQGEWQGLKTAGATLLAVEGLKAAIKEQRPDGSGNDSFPSGHTALAFAAATYFSIRYGQEYRPYVPVMYGLAALTGAARIKAKKHYAKDVIAGAAIGWGLAHLFTTPQAASISLAPTARGATLTYTRRF